MKFKDLYNLYYSHIIVEESNINELEYNMYEDYYLQLQEFYKEYKINSFICTHEVMDDSLIIKDSVFERSDVDYLLNKLFKNSNEYINQIYSFNEDIKVLLDNEYLKLGFNGTFPKYYNDKARLEVNYDYMFNLNNDRLLIQLYADVIRFVGESEERHFKLIAGKYDVSLEDEVSCFVNYQKEVRYLEVIERIINTNPKLPRWYKFENMPDRQLFRPFFFGSFVLLGSICSILSYIFFKSNTIVLVLSLVISGIISKVIADMIVKKYKK